MTESKLRELTRLSKPNRANLAEANFNSKILIHFRFELNQKQLFELITLPKVTPHYCAIGTKLFKSIAIEEAYHLATLIA